MQRFLIQILSKALVLVVLVAGVAVGAMAANTRVRSGQWQVPDVQNVVSEIRSLVDTPKPSKVIYLHRDALRVVGGADNAKVGETSLITLGEQRVVPRYAVSNATWNRLVRCVRKKFQDYDVVVTDKRPESESYILVKVGGKQADIGREGSNLGGIAPYNHRAIPNSIVFVFDQRGRYRTKNNCEAAAHEIAHVYGLDHTYDCKDVMSYQRGCGAKVFVNRAMKCGEHATRICEDGESSQNSARLLQAILGLRVNRERKQQPNS